MLTEYQIHTLISLVGDAIEDVMPEQEGANEYRIELERIRSCLTAMLSPIPASTSIHVVSIRYAGSSRSYYKLVRVAKSDPHQAAAALELAMKEIPSAVEGRYVRPANPSQIASANAEHNLNLNIIDLN